MGPGALGCLRDWAVCSLGWRGLSRGPCFSVPVALAWSPGFLTGPWIRHDLASDLDSDAHLLHPAGFSSARFNCDHLRQGFCSEQYWSGPDLTRPDGRSQLGCQCLVLDCHFFSAANMRWVLEVLPERATFKALNGKYPIDFLYRKALSLVP